MWEIAAAGGGVLALLILGYYLGHRVASASDQIAAKDEYIKRQTAILNAMNNAAKRGDDLAKFFEGVGDAVTPDDLNKLYDQIVPKTNAPDSGVLAKPAV
jgi:hypothetical protein